MDDSRSFTILCPACKGLERHKEVNPSDPKALSNSPDPAEILLAEMRIQGNMSKNCPYLLKTGPDHIMGRQEDI